MGLSLNPRPAASYIKRKIWPNLDEATQDLYESAIKNGNAHSVETIYSPYIYSYGKKAFTTLVVGAAIAASYYLFSLHAGTSGKDAREFNSLQSQPKLNEQLMIYEKK